MPRVCEVEERFWEKVDWTLREDRCWLWLAANSGRYGIFSFGPRSDRTMVCAHRMAYTLEVGEIPPGLHLDHLCRNTLCVNPSHLEPVTCSENNLRGDNPRLSSERMRTYNERRRNGR